MSAFHLCSPIGNDEELPVDEEIKPEPGQRIFKDGNKWCVLQGDNLQEGIAGFGDTITEALEDFKLKRSSKAESNGKL
jgi:hypothetical protein